MNNLIFLDTETTGKGPEDRMIQLCIKIPEEMAEPYNILLKAPVQVSFEAMAVHHITNEKIAELGQEWTPTLKENIQDMITGRILVAHNAPFDIAMLAKEGIKVERFIDTLKICQYLFDEPTYKLQYLRYRFSLEVEAKAHDAEGDVLVLEKLFGFLFKMSSEVEEMDMDKFIVWAEKISQQPALLRRMTFGKYRGRTFEDMARIDKNYLQWMVKQPDLDEDLKFTLKHYLQK